MWRPTTDKKFGVVIYSFNGKKTKHGLSLEIGESVQILEENGQGWFRGFSTRRKNDKGIFPASYIHLKKFKVDNKGKYETVNPVEETIVTEMTSVLREWGGILKKIYKEKDGKYQELYPKIKKVMVELIGYRCQIMSGDRTQEQLQEMKKITTHKIDWGNSQMQLDLVPRIDCEIADVDNTSIVDLFKLHQRSKEETESVSFRGTVRRKKKRESIAIHHMYCMLEKFECHIGEDAEFYLSLYDAKEGIFMSERFLTRKNKNEMKPNNLSALYTDLGLADLKDRDLYIVVHVVRVGRMLYKENEKKKSDQVYRRPYGCGAVSISDILVSSPEQHEDDLKQYFIKVYSCLNSEHDFPTLHENIIKKQTSKLSLSNQMIGIPISLRMLHGDVSQIKRENPLLFSRPVHLVRKLGFADVIMPGDARNDFYITLQRGEFEKGNKTSGKNVEVSMKVFDSDGKQMQDCISIGEGAPLAKEYNSLIFYHSNTPKWNEVVKLVMPPERCQGAHVRFEFRHCSNRDRDGPKKLYAFGFMKLTRADGATLADDNYEVFIYKCDESYKFHHCDELHQFRNVNAYLNLPSCHAELMVVSGSVVGNTNYQRNLKENFFIKTTICSTKLPQNLELVSLLRWKDHPEKIQHTLNRLMEIKGEEIVKCQDIIDTLFNILDEDTEAYGKPVFQALVFVIGILSDRRYQNLRTDLDTYIEKHFAGTLAHKPLISCLKQCAEEAIHYADKQKSIQRAFQAIPYLFKFIVQSRLLYARATRGKEETVFKEDINNLFIAMNNMVQQTSDYVLTSQMTLLSFFSTTYDCLLQEKGDGQTMFTIPQVALFAKNLIDNVAKEGVRKELHGAKLRCILDTVNSRLFEEEASRMILSPVFLHHIQLHLVQRQELKLCAEVLGDILTSLQKLPKSSTGEVQLLVQTLLDNLLQTLLTINRQGELTGQFVACLINTLKVMKEEHFTNLLNSFPDRKPLKEFITRIFMVFKELVKKDIFPQDWMVMRMATNDVILSAIQYFSQILTSHFLKGEFFDTQLWSSFFNLSVLFLTQPSLQLETFSEVKRNKIRDQYGDMRVLMGHEIESMWQNLGDHKVNFLQLIGPFLEVTLVPETELRRITIPFFFDMMQCEEIAKGSFKQVESDIIDKLDLLVGTKNKGDEEYRTLFKSILSEKIQHQHWREQGLAFVHTVARLLETLLDYRDVMTKEDEKFKQMSCTMNILRFYKDELKKKEMYKRYIYKLHDLHVPDQNYTEAAFTLKTLADSLQWSPRQLQADEEFPKQTEWQRKEALYNRIIELLDKGKTWEHGIPLCKELAVQYETKAFDYGKLSCVLKRQANFYDHILSIPRMDTDFYRVSFYGLNFPMFLRNKALVMRARVYERGDGIRQMIQSEFPAAQVWTEHHPPSEDIKQSNVQYIEVRIVNPIPEEPELFRDQTVPEDILKYYETNDVKRFYFDRPFHRGEKDPNNEIKSLWLDRTRLTISNSIPGILRWFEVKDQEKMDVSPLEHALETMQKKNKELRCLIASYASEPGKSINPLSMMLNGVIDAAVNGGIPKYQEAFFVPAYIAEHPKNASLISKLKMLILDQVVILGKGLEVHGDLAPADVKPLQGKLEEQYIKLRNGISDQGSPIASHRISSGSKPTTPITLPTNIPPPSPFTPPDDGTTFKIGLQEPLEPSRRPVSTISTGSCDSNNSSSSGVGTIPEGDEDAEESDNTFTDRIGTVPTVPLRQHISRMPNEPTLSNSSPQLSRVGRVASVDSDVRKTWGGGGGAPQIPPRPNRPSSLDPRQTSQSFREDLLPSRGAPDLPKKEREKRSNSVSPSRLQTPERAPPLPPKPKLNGGPQTRQSVHGYPTTPRPTSKPLPPTPESPTRKPEIPTKPSQS
ncbi:dedicator of cytokinesis protein 3-like isoform X1 [Glandiceps talaboti]